MKKEIYEEVRAVIKERLSSVLLSLSLSLHYVCACQCGWILIRING